MSDKLRPHQVGPANRLLSIFRSGVPSAVDWSITGSGKTYVGAFVALGLGKRCLVIGPKVAKTPWERAAAHFGGALSFCNYEMLRTGRTAFGKWDHNDAIGGWYFKCQCCQCVVDFDKFVPCYAHHLGIHCLETKKVPAKKGRFNFSSDVEFLIFDEVHRAAGLDSDNAELLLAARRQGIQTLDVSATPASSPLNMRALGYSLDLHNDKKDLLVPGRLGQMIQRPSFVKWLRGHKCRQDERFHGYKWFASRAEQQAIMQSIRDSIIPARGIRVTEADIPNFPKRVILPELYELDDPEAIDSAYKKMAEALDCLRAVSETDKAPEHPLTAILRQRQQIELLKIPTVEELAHDDLEKGFSVVFFVNFSQTIQELSKRFPDAGIIDGTPQGTRNRDKIVDAFQAQKLRKLIVNNEAGGVALSLQDLDGSYPRMGYVFPNFSATSMLQVFGRFQRDSGKSTCYYRVIFANKTVEMPIHRALLSKLDAMGALTDGSLADDDLRPLNLRFSCSALG